MRNIKLIVPWAKYVKGDWVAVDGNIAENLIAKGIACDPTRPKPEPEAAKPKAAKKKAKPKVAKKKTKARRK